MLAGERVRVHGSFADVKVVSQYLLDVAKNGIDTDVMTDVQMERAIDVDVYFLGSLCSRLIAYLRYRRALVKMRKEGMIVERMWSF